MKRDPRRASSRFAYIQAVFVRTPKQRDIGNKKKKKENISTAYAHPSASHTGSVHFTLPLAPLLRQFFSHNFSIFPHETNTVKSVAQTTGGILNEHRPKQKRQVCCLVARHLQ